MSSATSDVTYTSVYTDSEPGRAFWGADDEEVSEGGIPRVIVLGYDGLPIQPVAPPSPDYIPGPEDPQTPPVPQDEDEREPMFVQAHDPDYVPEPIYPEYIPLEDEHEFPAEEQPLPPVDSPTAESPGYVTESDPEEDPEEYEDDETEDGPVDYPMDGGDDGDDDDGDSSRDDANDEDEDDEDEEEEEEHLAPADSAIVVPVDEPVFPPEGTEPVIPPPSTDITIGARITVRPQTSISLPPEAEVERLLAMTTPSPSPPISLSPPSTGERLARIASTQALIDAVTAALPSPPLPSLPPSLYIPPPVDRRDDILESEQPPRKRLYLSTLGSRYEVEESSTARPTRGQGIDYGLVSTVDAKERRQGIRDVRYGIRGLVPQRQKASDYDNPDPAPELQNVSPSADTTVPSQQELDLLFGPLYDKFFNDAVFRWRSGGCLILAKALPGGIQFPSFEMMASLQQNTVVLRPQSAIQYHATPCSTPVPKHTILSRYHFIKGTVEKRHKGVRLRKQSYIQPRTGGIYPKDNTPKLEIEVPRIHKDGDGDALFQLKSDSLPHAHAHSTKTFYKYQDSRIMKAQELKTKTSAQTLIYKIFLQRYQVYQGRLLASIQDDAKYEHVGQDTRSQGGKDDQDGRIKI
ncbi:hypothetical protein Tco_1108087 [Tanacetum coccineum]